MNPPKTHKLFFEVIERRSRLPLVLGREGIITKGDLTLRSREQLSALEGIGVKRLELIEAYMAANNLTLRSNHQSYRSVIEGQFPRFLDAPVSYLAITYRTCCSVAGVLNPYYLSRFNNAGIFTISDLWELRPNPLPELVKIFGSDGRRMESIFEELNDFLKLIARS